MIEHAVIEGGVPVRYTGRFITASTDPGGDPVQHPLRAMTRHQKLAIGVYEIERINAVPPGYTKTGTELVLQGEVVTERPTVAPLGQAALQRAIREHAAAMLRAIAAEYEPEERETWTQQVTEARALIADNTAPSVMVRALAEADRVDPVQMAQFVLAKADAYTAMAGAILSAQRSILSDEPLSPDFASDPRWPSLQPEAP